MNATFIYALCEPGTRTIRYIGKSDAPEVRFRNHLQEGKIWGTHKNNWLISLGEKVPDLIVLKKVPSLEWEEWEQRYIRCALALGLNLTNLSRGGVGTFGRKCSDRTRKKLRDSGIGRITSLETKDKIRKALLGRKHSSEQNEKNRQGHLGIKKSPETIKKMRLAALARWKRTCGE